MTDPLKEAIERAGEALERSGFRNVYERLREERPRPPMPKGATYLCEYHDSDMDNRGIPFPSQDWVLQIWCQACRVLSLKARFHEARLPVKEIRTYEAENPWALQTLAGLKVDR